MLRLEMVSKTFARRGTRVMALGPTTLQIGKGEFVAVVGPSGSGKTTLLSLVGGMLAPTSGKVWLDGQSLYDLPVSSRAAIRARKIGFVFQTFNLVPYLTAVENVEVPLYISGMSPAEQRRRAISALTRLGLGDRLHHKPGELSVGQQQRVALARTLANDPALILADEPTGNLDPTTRDQVMSLLSAFHREGRTIVMATHDPVVAEQGGRTVNLAAAVDQTAEGETASAHAA